MSPVLSAVRQGWLSFARCWIITRREVRDTLRDWRLVVPILSLTLVFPALMQFTANIAQRWVVRYGASIVGERIIPFLMMVVGFFPISFSLVIALETFVGEKERHSLEPLLATPLTNSELYWGKTLAAMIPPVVASYLGLAVYLVGLFMTMRWTPPLQLLMLVVLLTTAEALVMVSGAVVISSQTTSVRAANILASFVIIPMAVLVQGESVIMFWANYDALWWLTAGLVMADLLLVRMGAHLFNREELLGRDIDQLDLRRLWRTWRAFFLGPPEGTTSAARTATAVPAPPFTIWRLYRRDLPAILRKSALPIAVVLVTQLGAFVVGWQYSHRYILPVGAIDLEIPENAFQDIPEVGFLPSFDAGSILFHNLRVVLLETVTGLFSCGAASLVLLMIPQAIIGFFAGQVSMMGANPILFLATFILPHGIVELPAAIIATGMALRLGATVVSRPSGLSLTEGVLLALADLVKVLVFLVLPLLGMAAMLEVWLTPWIVTRVW
jgi:ABC-type transport system involved in multi-copper enzyme maturation permease subunit